jgi:hypothetical protein
VWKIKCQAHTSACAPLSSTVRPHLSVVRTSSLTLRSAVLACALALVFLTIVAVPIEFFSLFKNAPSPIVEAHSALWRIFFFPLEVVPNLGELIDHVFSVNSPDPAIALIPFLLSLFVLWALILFLLIVAIKLVRRAA